jgi:TetR/AcrR family transcriptional repressor of bet genes
MVTSDSRSARRHEKRRDEIVQAARRVLMDIGYEAASIKEIARAADVAPGLIHYYFETKEDLLVAVVEAIIAENRVQFRRLWEEKSAEGDALASNAYQLSLATMKTKPEVAKLKFELFVVGLRNPAVKKAVAKIFRGRLENITMIVHAAGGDPKFAEGLAMVIDSMIDGLAMRTLIDESFEPEVAYRVLEEMSRALRVAQGTKGKKARTRKRS